MWFLLLALGGLIVAANQPKPAPKLVSGEDPLPWQPPPGSTLVASVKGVKRGTPFPVDVYNWTSGGILFVLAIAPNDSTSFVAYCASRGPFRKQLLALGGGTLTQRIKSAALQRGTERAS